MNAKNLHIIKVKYLPATNYRGARIKLISERFKNSVTLQRDYMTNSGTQQAITYLRRQGQRIVGQGEGIGCEYVILSAVNNSFKEIK